MIDNTSSTSDILYPYNYSNTTNIECQVVDETSSKELSTKLVKVFKNLPTYYTNNKNYTFTGETYFNDEDNFQIHDPIYVDSEFGSEEYKRYHLRNKFQVYKRSLPLSIQIKRKGQEPALYYHPSLQSHKLFVDAPQKVKTRIKEKTYRGLNVIEDYGGFILRKRKMSDGNNKHSLVLHPHFFFSMIDLTSLFADYRYYQRKMSLHFQQQRVINNPRDSFGRETLFDTELVAIDPLTNFERVLLLSPKDISGLMAGGLKAMSEAHGIKMLVKDTMDEFKTWMIEALLTGKMDILEFERYAIDDSIPVELIPEKHLILMNTIRNTMGFREVSHVKSTTGANVGSIIVDWMTSYLIKTGVQIDEEKLTDWVNYERYSKGQNPKKNTEDNPNLLLTGLFMYMNDRISSSFLLAEGLKTSGKNKRASQVVDSITMIGMLDGGRCRNERPRDTKYTGLVVDIDISSCYGAALAYQTFPVGKARTWSTRIGEEKQLTLREFINKFHSYISKGMWLARVSTIKQLSFDIDLLISKYAPTNWDNYLETRGENAEDKGVIDPQADGEFVLNMRELHNAVLTEDLLQIIRRSGKKTEIAEFLDTVKIDSMVYFNEKDRVNNPQDVFDALLEEKEPEEANIHKGNEGNGGIKTYHSFKWCAVPMGDLVNRLLLERGRYKKKTSLDELYKLIINSLYGVEGSPDFRIGNTFVANCVTARARGLGWMMQKAFGSVQTITDGGVFYINEVFLPNNSGRMGLHELTHQTDRLDYFPKYGSVNMNKYTSYKIPLPSTFYSLNDIDSMVTKEAIEKYQWSSEGGKDENGKTTLINVGLPNGSITGSKDQWGFLNKLTWHHLHRYFQRLKGIKYDNQSTGIDILDKYTTLVSKEPLPKPEGDIINSTSLVDHHGLYTFDIKDIFFGVATQSQANYILLNNPIEDVQSGKISLEKLISNAKIAARGHKTKNGFDRYDNEKQMFIREEEMNEYSVIKMFRELFDNKQITPSVPTRTENIIKVKQYQKRKNGYQDTALGEEVYAFDIEMRFNFFHPISYAPFRYLTRFQYNAWRGFADKLHMRTAWGLEVLFIDNDSLLDYDTSIKELANYIERSPNNLPETWVKEHFKMSISQFLDICAVEKLHPSYGYGIWNDDE